MVVQNINVVRPRGRSVSRKTQAMRESARRSAGDEHSLLRSLDNNPSATMTLWTFCQSMLLTFNAFAILNEQRFLDKYGLGQGAVNSGYVPSGSARGQLIGVVTATQYARVPLVVLNVLVIFVKMVFG